MKPKILATISGAILLMVIALHYGYPLVTADTAAYINFGFHFTMPVDRPPFYGVFIRHSSLWASLWYPVLAQSLIVSFLLIRYIRHLYGAEPGLRHLLLNLLIIASCTCVSWVSSQLMPDIFGAILLLAVMLFYHEKDTSLRTRILYIAIIACCTLVHNSHFLILAGFAGIILLHSLYLRHKARIIRSLTLISVSVISFLSLCTLNKIYNNTFTFSRGSHVFMMSKLAETGILDQYLEDECPAHNYSLCQFKGNFPDNAVGFLWTMDGPLYQTGGWYESKPQYDSIIHGVFTSPKYLSLFAQKSAISTLRQLSQVQVGQPDGNQARFVHDAILAFFPHELKEYRTGAQITSTKSIDPYNNFYILVLLASSAAVLTIAGASPHKRQLLVTYAFLLLFLFCNAWVTATFGNVWDRLNNRVIWLLPATNIIVLLRHAREKWLRNPEINKN